MPHQQRGFGLVELMIALTLGLALTGAVLQATLASQRNHSLLEAGAQLQENGRFALRYLSQGLRTAGFMGCPNLSHIKVNVISDAPPDDMDFTGSGVISGLDNVGTSNDYSAVAGTDIVEFQRAGLPATRLAGNLPPNNANIQVESNPAGLVRNDYVFITDCVNADLFTATTVSNSQNGGNSNGGSSNRAVVTITHAEGVNTSNRLSKVYGEDAMVMGFESVAYFIRDTNRDTAKGHSIHSLYIRAREPGSGGTAPVAQELVEGVEDMQLTYGVDTSDDRTVDAYKTAADISDWSKVLSVRINLLMQSIDDSVVSSAQRGLIFNADAVNTNDGRLRQTYSTAVAIRNRLP
ncbi:PilW family protein [Litorivivens sp.]|uniref:PilW family protein n=1 Tax=Litorivivens sp. TaxID=2020868 RepID=UPI00356806C0